MSDTLLADAVSARLGKLETALTPFLPPRLIAVMREGAKRNCLSEVTTLVAFLAGQRPYLQEATSESIDFTSAADLFKPEDTSDFLPLLRLHKLLTSCSLELRQLKCRQMRICHDTFSRACALRGDLCTLATMAGFQLNSTPAAHRDLVACFVQAYADSIVHQCSDKYINLNGQTLKVRFDFNCISWDAGPYHMLLLVTRWRQEGHTWWAEEATRIDYQIMKRAYKDRLQRKINYYSSLNLKCSQEWLLDGRQVIYIAAEPAPHCPSTSKAIADAIAFKGDLVPGTREGFERIKQLNFLRQWFDSGLPEFDPQAYHRWLLPRVRGAYTTDALNRRAARLTLSWKDIEYLTGTTNLEQRIAAAAAAMPDKVTLGGHEFEPYYTYLNEAKAVYLEAHEEPTAFFKALDHELPAGWNGLQIKLNLSNNGYPSILRVHQPGREFFRDIRREMAALSGRLSLGSHHLMGRNGVLLRKVKVNHPGYSEEVWLVADRDNSYYLDYQEALAVARKDLHLQLKRALEEILNDHKLYWSPLMIATLVNQALPLANQDFSNLAELRDFLRNTVTNSLQAPGKLLLEHFQQLITDLRQRDELRLVGKCMTLAELAKDALEQGDILEAEELLSQAKAIQAQATQTKKVTRSA